MRRLARRQREPKHRAAARAIVAADAAAVRFHDGPADREPEPRATARARPEEFFEDRALLASGQPRPAIRDLDDDLVAVAARLAVDRLAWRRWLGRVLDQVDQDRLDQ